MNTLLMNDFCELSEIELFNIDGGWTWKSTVDVAVAVGCVAVGCTGPAGAVVAAIVSVGYTVGRGI